MLFLKWFTEMNEIIIIDMKYTMYIFLYAMRCNFSITCRLQLHNITSFTTYYTKLNNRLDIPGKVHLIWTSYSQQCTVSISVSLDLNPRLQAWVKRSPRQAVMTNTILCRHNSSSQKLELRVLMNSWNLDHQIIKIWNKAGITFVVVKCLCTSMTSSSKSQRVII